MQFSLREDTNADTRYWFDFEVNGAAGRDVVFRVPASENMYGSDGWDRKQPVASRDGGQTWSRITEAGVSGAFYTFRYRPSTDSDRIALTLPYPWTRWTTALANLEGHALLRSSEVIGMSLEGNPVHMLELGDAAGDPDSTRAHVWVVARQHPGEPEGSYMAEGFMDWLLSDAPEAATLRTRSRVFVVPFLNPDGVLAGNQRVNSVGLDLNRQWASPTAASAPTILATQQKMRALSGEGGGVRIILDFHGAPPTSANFFIFNDEADVGGSLFAEMSQLTQVAASANPDFSLTRSFSRGLGNGERTRSWAFEEFGAHGLTIEGSGVDTGYGPFAGQQMTAERYLALGAAVGEAVGTVLFGEP